MKSRYKVIAAVLLIGAGYGAARLQERFSLSSKGSKSQLVQGSLTAMAEMEKDKERLLLERDVLHRKITSLESTIQQLKAIVASEGAKVVDPMGHEGRSEVFDKLPGLKNLIERGDFKASTQLLSEAHGSGKITQLELMQLAVQFPDLITEGMNNYSFSDGFRSILINSLSSLEDLLAVLTELTLEDEPNQGFSAKVSSLIAGIVDASSALDLRVLSVIKKTLGRK